MAFATPPDRLRSSDARRSSLAWGMIVTMGKLTAVAFTLVLGALAWAPQAGADPAQPEFVSADPEPNKIAHTPPDEVSVTFDEVLDPLESTLRVAACGRRVDAGDMTVTGETMRVSLEDAPVGRYRVRYSATGANDTPEQREDPTTDEYTFSLHTPRCARRGMDDHGPHDPGDGDGDGNDKGPHKHDRDGRGDHEGADHRGGTEGDGHDEHPSSDGEVSHAGSDHGGGETHGPAEHMSDQHGGDEGERKAPHGGRHGSKGREPGHRRHHPDRPRPPTAQETGGGGGESATVLLALVLALPALVGAGGGVALRRRTA